MPLVMDLLKEVIMGCLKIKLCNLVIDYITILLDHYLLDGTESQIYVDVVAVEVLFIDLNLKVHLIVEVGEEKVTVDILVIQSEILI